MNIRKIIGSFISRNGILLIKKIADTDQIGDIQNRLLEIGRRNPEYLNESIELANLLTEEGDTLVTTFVENQLPSGEKK